MGYVIVRELKITEKIKFCRTIQAKWKEHVYRMRILKMILKYDPK
jgi:hypothetical protein